MVLRRQVRRQEANGRQVHRPVREQVEDHRKLPSGSRGLDAVAGGGLGEPQDLGAVPEERPRPLRTMELTDVELREVGDELDGRLARALREELQLGVERVVGKLGRDGEEVRVHVSS